MKIIYEFSRNTSQTETSFQLNIEENTIMDWYRFCRDRIIEDRSPLTGYDSIGGDGIIVEIDECLLSKRKYNRGRLVNEQWIFGGIERRRDGFPQKFFVIMVHNRTKSTLQRAIQEKILPGSTIYHDGWAAYGDLEEIGFQHGEVIHDRNFVNPLNPNIHTQNIENFWMRFKKHMNKKGTNRRIHLDEYFKETIFRIINGEEIFEKIIILIIQKYAFI